MAPVLLLVMGWLVGACTNDAAQKVTSPVPPGETSTTQREPAVEPAESPSQSNADAADTDVANPLIPKLDTRVAREWRCPVIVEAVLADERFRGHRDTPAHQAWVSGMSPDEYQMYLSESHGETYRSCTYQVKVQSKNWRYIASWSTTFHDLADTWCEDAREHVAASIQRTTHGCTDLHRGAYYGSDLVPIP